MVDDDDNWGYVESKRANDSETKEETLRFDLVLLLLGGGGCMDGLSSIMMTDVDDDVAVLDVLLLRCAPSSCSLRGVR